MIWAESKREPWISAHLQFDGLSFCVGFPLTLFSIASMNAAKKCVAPLSVLTRHRFSIIHFAIAASVLFCASPANGELLVISDQTVQSHAAELKTRIAQRDSQGYLVPSQQQRTDFRSLANGLWNASSTADLQRLTSDAEAVGYDVLLLNDGNDTYYGLQESGTNDQPKGWGSFLLRQGSAKNALVEVVHPLADINTLEISSQAFAESDARGFLIAGAHRNANGQATADVAHLDESIFQEVHQSFAENVTDVSVWQIHGFDIDIHPEVPNFTDTIISAGTGGVTEIVLGLDQQIDELEGGWDSFSFNTLDVEDPLNVATNGLIEGTTFSSLAATTNIQQLHTTSIGGQFVHIELEQSFRIDGGESARQLIAQTIADSISSSATAIPEPSAFVFVGLLSGFFAIGRRRAI